VQDHPDLLLAHGPDQVRQVLRRRGHAGAILDHAHLDEPERAVEVRAGRRAAG
jgi:hypothetical protein